MAQVSSLESRVSGHSEGAMVEPECSRAHGSVVKGPSELQLERGGMSASGEERRES